jgi:hypothetical protein
MQSIHPQHSMFPDILDVGGWFLVDYEHGWCVRTHGDKAPPAPSNTPTCRTSVQTHVTRNGVGNQVTAMRVAVVPENYPARTCTPEISCKKTSRSPQHTTYATHTKKLPPTLPKDGLLSQTWSFPSSTRHPLPPATPNSAPYDRTACTAHGQLLLWVGGALLTLRVCWVPMSMRHLPPTETSKYSICPQNSICPQHSMFPGDPWCGWVVTG